MSWRIKFFQTARGAYPVKEFIESQDEATYAKILHLLNLLSNNGPYLMPPYVKKVRSKLFEVRISGKIAVRILYFMTHNEYYLLHAFKKKSPKMPEKELKIAVDRMNELI